MATVRVCELADETVTVDMDELGVLTIANEGPATIAFQFYGILSAPIGPGGWLLWQPDPCLDWLVKRGAAEYRSELTAALRILSPTTAPDPAAR